MLSVIIPTFNEEEYLPRLLESLRRQTCKEIEVVVADASSTDRTRKIAVEGGCRLVQGGLPSVGRNAGAIAAKGDLFLFLDADVILSDEAFISRMVEEFERHRLDVATALIEPLSSNKLDVVFYQFYNSYISMTEKILPHAHGFCILVRRTVHEAIGGFDKEVRLAEDHDYAQRAGKVGRFGVIRGSRIPVSTRRFERDGHLATACRYILCELHMWTLGSVKSDIFKYRFGYPKAGASERRT